MQCLLRKGALDRVLHSTASRSRGALSSTFRTPTSTHVNSSSRAVGICELAGVRLCRVDRGARHAEALVTCAAYIVLHRGADGAIEALRSIYRTIGM